MTANQESLPRANGAVGEASFDRRLLSYAIAAGATLAAGTPSRAEVLFTPNNSVLKPPSSLVIDLDHDGVADFRLKVREVFLTSSSFAYGFGGMARVYGVRPENQWVVGRFGWPQPLQRGERIGKQNLFQSDGLLATGRDYFGLFNNVQNRFLGVKLIVNGEVHYGWIGFRRVDARRTIQLTLAGWAYETTPDTPIIAGDKGTGVPLSSSTNPTSLEILSAGHIAIVERRQRTSQ